MKRKPSRNRRPVLEELEAQVLYSADALGGLDAVLVANHEESVLEASLLESQNKSTEVSAANAATSSEHVEKVRYEIVFVDTDTENYQQLVDDLTRNSDATRQFAVYVLDNTRDGIEQISSVLAGYSDLDAMHIIGHGDDGVLDLGGSQLSSAELNAHAARIAGWADAFSDSGDLLIYGCELAATVDGQALVDSLATLTGTDVAASNDLTGAAALGGDWELEYSVGKVDSRVALSQKAQHSYSGVLNLTAEGDETRVNTSTTGNQMLTPFGGGNIAIDAGGNYVVVWTDINSNSGDIYLQRYDASGVAQGANLRVNTTTANVQSEAQVAMDDSGNFVVVWQSAGQDGSGTGVYAQRFDASGVAHGGEFRVNTVPGGDQSLPSVAMASDGSFAVSWTDNRSGNDDVYVQRFDATGVAQGGEIVVNSTTAGVQHYSSVAMDASGNMVVSWESDQSGDVGIFAQRYNASGVAQGSEFQVNTYTSNEQWNSVVAMADNGNFVVVWESQGQDAGSSAGIYGQLYNASGVAQGSEFLINEASSNDQTVPHVAMDASGRFIVTWKSDLQDGSDSGVYARLFDADGTALGDEVLVNSTTLGIQSLPSVAYANDQAIVTWYGNGPGDGDGVFTQRFSTLNRVAVAVDSAVTTARNASAIINAAGSATDADTDAISVIEFTQPTNGSVVDHGDGTLTYTPDNGYVGADSFEYVVMDAGSGLAHYYGLDGNATDLVGGANGVLNGTTTVAGDVGNGLSFNETSDYVSLPDISYNSEFSISFEFRVDELNGNLVQYLYSHGDINAANSINVFLTEDAHATDPNVLRTVVRDANDTLDGTALEVDIASLVGDGQLHTYTLTAGANGLEVFIDGVLVASDATRGVDGVNPTGDVILGSRQDFDGARMFGGVLDSVQIFDNALAASQVADLASSQNRASVTIDVTAGSDAPTAVGSGIELNTDGGNDAYLIAADGGAILGGASEFTVEVSFATESADRVQLASYVGGSMRDDLSLALESDGTASIIVDNVAVSGLSGIDYNSLRDGDIHNVALSWDNTNGDWAIYVDGVLTDSGTGLATGGTLNGSAGVGGLVFGQEQDAIGGGFNSAEVFSGTLYDVRIWNDVRSEPEIALNRQHRFDSGNLPAGLIANWRMDGFNEANEVVDVVSSNNLSIGNVLSSPVIAIDQWTDQNGGASASGNIVTFVDEGQSGWNSEVNSVPLSSLGFTDDYTVSFQLDNLTNFGLVIGLGASEAGGNFTDVDYSMYFDHNLPGMIASYDEGSAGSTVNVGYVAGDVFSFYVNGTTIEYQHNGVTFYTATDVAPGTELYIDSAFYAAAGGYANQDDYSLSNFSVRSGNATVDDGFISSTPTYGLQVSENAGNGTSVGFVVPTDPNVVTNTVTDIVSDGLFTEGPDPGYYSFETAGDTFGGWTVRTGNINVLGSYAEDSPLGGNSVELSGYSPGGIYQTLNTTAGTNYQVVFALSGNWNAGEAIKDLRVLAAGESQDYAVARPAGWNSSSNMLFSDRSFTFTATGSSTDLDFLSLDAGDYGAVIADVRVYEVPAAVTAILNNDPTLSYDALTDKFYRVVSNSEQFDTAVTNATSSSLNGVSGQLVTVRSEYENTLVQGFAVAAGNNVWLGATDRTTEGEFSWLDGASDGDTFWTGGQGGSAVGGAYSNFLGSGPDDAGGQDELALLLSGGEWDDRSAGDSNAYVIEWDASAVLTNFTFALTDDASGRFSIDSSSGEITVADGSLLDYETSTSHNITIEVTDATGNAFSQIRTIAVDNNQEPVQAVPGSQTIDANAVLTFSASSAVPNAVTVSDTLAGTDSPMQVQLSVNDGVLNLSGLDGIAILNGGQGSSSITIAGLESDINAALEGMTFTPTTDFEGSVSLEVSTSVATAVSALEGHYTFDGGAALDQSAGAANDGTLTGGATTTIDPERGEVLSVPGNGASVSINGLFGEPANVTLAAWVNLASADVNGAEVISLGDSVLLRLQGNGTNAMRAAFHTGVGSGWEYVSFDVGSSLVGAGWRHVAFSFNDVENTATLYLDGIAVSSSSVTGSIIYGQGANTLIGTHADGATNRDFNGLIDDARIYTRAISADEVAALAADRATTSDSVDITVAPVNDAPVFAGLDGNPTFIEDGTAVQLDADVTIFDEELSALDDFGGATLTLARAGGANSDDVFSASGNLVFNAGTLELAAANVGSYTNAAGILTLAFDAGVTNAQVNEIMHSIAYANSSNTPPASVQIEWAFDDGNAADAQGAGPALTASGSTTVNITAVNDAPVLTVSPGGGTYYENTSGNYFDATLTIVDGDSADFDGGQMTVSVSANGEATDILAIRDGSGVSVVGSDVRYDFGAGPVVVATVAGGAGHLDPLVITFNSQSDATSVQAVARQVAFSSSSDAPSTAQRTLEMVVTDGDGGTSATAQRVMNVIALNDAVVIDLDANDSAASGLDFAAAWTEGGGAVSIADSDASLVDPDNPNLQSITITITNLLDGADEVLSANTAGTAIVASYDSINGILTLSGNHSVADYQQVLRTVTYDNAAGAPDETARTITFVANDGTDESAVATTTLSMTGVNTAAIVSGDTSYTGDEGDIVGGDMDASDADGLNDGTIFSVTSAATNGNAAIDPVTGVWTFTPADPNWFGSDSFTVTVTDDLGGTTEQVVNITLANVDDTAVITGDVSFNGNEGDAVGGDMNASDVDGLTDGTYFTVTAAATNGTAAIDPETGVWTFTPTDPNWFGTDSFTVTVTDDLGGTTEQVVSITLANVDDTAVITGDVSFNGNEGDAVGGDMDATDVDGLTDGTYFTVTSAAANGTAAIDPETGVWTFTPADPNWQGTDSFTVTVTDDLGGTTEQVVSITLANVDDAAVITGDVSYTGDEGDTVGGDLNATDTDGLTDGTYFTVTSAAANGTAAIDPETGVWTFVPTDPNWFGSDSFTVTVTDDLGGTTEQVVSITLANVDDAAVITGDVSFNGNEGDVVGGDMDATDVDGLTDGTYFTVTSAATNGTAAIDTETGVWTFVPTDPNWFGSDSFTVTVTDDLGGTTEQVVSITLANVDDAAVITGDISYSGDEGDTVGGDLNATDVDGLTDGTYFTVTSAAANGAAAIDPETGVWTFVPTDPNWFGSDSFTVTVTDDLGGTTEQVVNITLANVDDTAVITGDVSFNGNEGDVVGGDMDATDVDGLTDGTYFTVTSAAANGTAAIDPETGVWTFTPTDPNWQGTDSFTVTVTDDLGGTTEQIVNVTLANVDNDAVITGDLGYTGEEGDSVSGDLDATDVDGLTDGTYFTVTAAATNGTAAIDPETGVWTFVPTDPNWFGSDSFTVTVTDDLGGTTEQVVNITLANVDDTAVITGDVSFNGNEGDAVGGDMDATDVDGLTDGTYFTVTSAAANGTAAIDPETGVWTFVPTDPNWFGSDSFTVTVTDDLGGTTEQVVNITLANLDDTAVITGDLGYTGEEGDSVSGDLDATDVDGLTDGTYFTVTSAAANGAAAIDPETGVWTFTPTDPNWQGTDSFTVTVTDDLGGTTEQVVSITLANVDDAAVITGDVSFNGNEGDVVGGDMDATDVDGLTDGTYFTVTSAAANGTAAIDPETGVWTFVPTDPSWQGTDSFTVTVTDDLGGTTEQVVSITLANVDDAAVITGDVSYTGDEGDTVGGDLNATDVDGLTDGTYFTVTSAAANGTAAIDPETGVWTFVPTDPNWFGSDSFTVTVTDDLGGTTEQVVSITLANVDDAAVITGDISYSGDEGDTVGGDLDATDIDGLTDGTYFAVTAAATSGTAAINPETGVWTFTPTDPNWFGTDSFTVTVTDDLGGTTEQVVSITLANVDDAAVITGDVSFNGNEGDVVGGDMDATDVDGLADGTYFTVTSAAANGTAAIDPETGVWTFAPTDPNWQGTDSFTVTVTDDLGGTTEQVVSITLANVDDTAVITGDVSYTGDEGDTVGGDLNATDVDGLTDGTYFTVTSAAANGTAAIDPETGVWTFVPTDPNWFGSDSFTVTVTDDLGGTTEQVVSITLATVGDAAAVITGDLGYTGNEGDAVSGDLDATDNDGLTDGTYFTVTAAASNGTATIDPETGVWSFVPSDPDWFGTDSFIVSVADDRGGTTEQVVNITLTNVDDAAVITGDIHASGNEGDTLRGDMDAIDPDGLTDGSIFTVVAPASNGTALIDPGSGAWTYVPDDPDWFGDDQFTVAITDDQGGTTNQVVSIALAATGDAPTLGGVISGTITEDENVIDGQLVLQGVATIADPDPGESAMRSNVAIGSYGMLTNDTNGAWVYVADNASEMIQSLDEGETLLDTLVVTTADGTTAEVQITIQGSEDLAEVSGDDAGSVAVQQVFTASGSLSITDVDSADNPVFEDVASVVSDNGYGRFEMKSGVWTYTLNTFGPALELLQPGQILEDSVEFTASDGTKAKVVVFIIGKSEEFGFTSTQTTGVTQDSRPSLTDIVTVAAASDDTQSGNLDNHDAASVVAEQTAAPDEDTPAAELNSALEDGFDAFVSQASEVRASDNATQTSNNTILVTLDALSRRSDAAGVPAAFVAPSEALLREIMMTEFDVGPLAIEDAAPLTLVEQLAQQEALRAAMEIVREDTRSFDESGRTTAHAIDISLRVGGAVLSTGSLAWLLRGAGLFASALTSIPAWKGFDPLPVLTRQKREDIEDGEDDVAGADGDSEEAVGRVLDNIGSNSTQRSPSPDNRDLA